jgi:hypothetical protein
LVTPTVIGVPDVPGPVLKVVLLPVFDDLTTSVEFDCPKIRIVAAFVDVAIASEANAAKAKRTAA